MRIGYLLQNASMDMGPELGPQVHIKSIIRALRDRGHSVIFVQQATGGARWTDDGIKWRYMSVPHCWWLWLVRLVERPIRLLQTVFGKLIPYANFFDSLYFACVASAILGKVDVLYERHFFMSYAGVMLQWMKGAPLLLEVNGVPFDEMLSYGEGLNRLQATVSRALTRFTFANASRVLPSGYGWEQRLIDLGLLEKRWSQVVWPGSGLLANIDDADILLIRDQWDLPDGVVVVFAGGFDPWQGLNHLVVAFANAIRQTKKATLMLIGDGPLRSEIEALAAHEGISEYVRFAGALQSRDYSDLLAVADIGIQTYHGRAEHVGMKLLDYMASGLAIVASCENGQHDLLLNGETAILVQPQDVGGLTAALERLFVDSGYRHRLGCGARRVFRQGHTWQHRAIEIENLAMAQIAEPRRRFFARRH